MHAGKLCQIFDNQKHNYTCDYHATKYNPFVLQENTNNLKNINYKMS